jgi:hypothetical protein
MSVRVAQGVRYLARDAQRVVEGELLLALQPVAQRFPFYEGHDVIQESAGRFRRTPGVIQRQDMRMVQVGGGRDLAQEALGPRAWTSPGSPPVAFGSSPGGAMKLVTTSFVPGFDYLQDVETACLARRPSPPAP